MENENQSVVTGRGENAVMLYKTPNSKVMPVIQQHQKDAARPVSFITEQNVYAMSDAARTMRDGERNELLIITMFQCTLRVTETIKLNVSDKINVQGKHVLAVMGKGNKPRLVSLPEKLSYHLGDYAQRKGLGPADKLFPITRQRAWQIIKLCAEKAGIDRRVYCHLLRHGGAVVRLKQTGNPKSLQIHLGHSDMKMTMRYLATTQVIDSLETEGKVEFEK